jgi:ribonuclease BN (tRNA processing enzyme)
MLFEQVYGPTARPPNRQRERELDSSAITQVVLLGTGTPNAEAARSGPAVAIVVNDTPYLVDFGPGVVRRAAAAHEAGIAGLAVEKLSRAFLTHLHSDHTAGYPDLILTPWVLERVEPLHVWGPPGLQHMTDHILTAYRQDIDERLHGLEPANDTGCQVVVQEIAPGMAYEDKNVAVEAFQVKHGSLAAYGYRFRTPDCTVVISGDTAPTESIVEKSRGCDVLIHEVYSMAGLQTRPPAWQEYHAHVHTSSHELAEIAGQAAPALLVLYHQLFWGVSEEELLSEIQTLYGGAVACGRDLDVYQQMV